MGYSYTFTFRLTAEERQLLAALAQRLYRTESSTLRWLIYEAACERGIIQHPAEANTVGRAGASHVGEKRHQTAAPNQETKEL